MAHAWIDAHVTAGLEERFLRLRQLERWNDHGDEWEQRGTEHAAEIVEWALPGSGDGRTCRRSPTTTLEDRGGLRAPHRSDAPGLTARVPRS